MKTWTIEVQRIKAMNNVDGLIRAQLDAVVQATTPRDDAAAPGTVLTLNEDTARVLLLLLKAQLAELDSRKAKSRR